MHMIDRDQGETQSGYSFGYIFIGEGGVFFTWDYDPNASHNRQVRSVIATMEKDAIDPPTGRWTFAGAERALRHHIAQHGLLEKTARD